MDHVSAGTGWTVNKTMRVNRASERFTNLIVFSGWDRMIVEHSYPLSLPTRQYGIQNESRLVAWKSVAGRQSEVFAEPSNAIEKIVDVVLLVLKSGCGSGGTEVIEFTQIFLHHFCKHGCKILFGTFFTVGTCKT